MPAPLKLTIYGISLVVIFTVAYLLASLLPISNADDAEHPAEHASESIHPSPEGH